jgi:CubicO group peptidase (beta-lactamase class C family)
MVLELYFEKPLDILFQNLLEELGLPSKALFFPSPSDRGLGIFVPTSYCPLRCRILCGEVHDENAAALAGVAGHAGLFGSGESLLLFLKALNHSILGAKLIETNGLYLSDQGDPLMGWRQGSHRHGRGFAQGFGMGHLGFTGTAFFIDHLTGRYVICLTNRVISGREAPWMSDFRFGLFSALEGFFV